MKQATITYHLEPEGWWAESRDLPGWTAVGETFDQVHELAESAVAEFLGEGVMLREERGPAGRAPTEAAEG